MKRIGERNLTGIPWPVGLTPETCVEFACAVVERAGFVFLTRGAKHQGSRYYRYPGRFDLLRIGAHKGGHDIGLGKIAAKITFSRHGYNQPNCVTMHWPAVQHIIFDAMGRYLAAARPARPSDTCEPNRAPDVQAICSGHI